MTRCELLDKVTVINGCQLSGPPIRSAYSTRNCAPTGPTRVRPAQNIRDRFGPEMLKPLRQEIFSA